MPKICYSCGKHSVMGGSKVMKGIPKKKGGIGLHCTGTSKRRFKPNLQRVKARIDKTVKTIWVCTSCIQKGLVDKA
ncbi:MAG: 50S ribosomal protein L28 [Candidatus Aureabacteria bacterium]|nr:50S ribosomal protein L28 [Candidatus Auribacterota bacterium]